MGKRKEYTPHDWIKDLTSGEFYRGKGQLAKFDPLLGKTRFCCLGVLNERMGLGARPAATVLYDAAPLWLRGYDSHLGACNDMAEVGDFWDPSGPVVSYIKAFLVPEWERLQREASGDDT